MSVDLVLHFLFVDVDVDVDVVVVVAVREFYTSYHLPNIFITSEVSTYLEYAEPFFLFVCFFQ